jgi:hypothetical protein
MRLAVLIPALTALLAIVFAVALLDQWRERRHTFQLVWGLGFIFYGVASACEALAASGGWSDGLAVAWYLDGGVWTVGWLGLGTAFLLGRTRFGYGFALSLFLAGLFTFLTWQKYPDTYTGAGTAAIVYFLLAGALALAVGVATYFQDERWPRLAAIAVVGATLVSLGIAVTTPLTAGAVVDPSTSLPALDRFSPVLRLLTPFMNVTGSFALGLGALFSAYVFMPKRRVLAYSLDPEQPGDQFLFNLAISPVAITVNFLASLPGATRALLAGRIHSRVPATILIAVGAFIPAFTDSLYRFGAGELFELGKFLGVVFLFAGFLVSIEVFREIRVPFTHIVLRGARHERAGADGMRAGADEAPEPPRPQPTASA